jgi:large subunit ribosomal protein L29
MKISEVRGMTTPEIESKVDDAREELFKLRFQFRTGQLTDYSRIVVGRQTIARMLTILRERQLAEQLAAAAKPAASQPAGEGEKA